MRWAFEIINEPAASKDGLQPHYGGFWILDFGFWICDLAFPLRIFFDSMNNVFQYIARADAGQLVDVANQQQVHPRRNRLEQVISEIRSSIEASSTISRSPSSGRFLRCAETASLGGLGIRARPMDGLGLSPVVSDRRLAARPVGAVRSTWRLTFSHRCKMERMVVVLPALGPPVNTVSRLSMAAWIA